jgi:hypothetical protein
MQFLRLFRRSACFPATTAFFSVSVALLVCWGLSGCNRLRPQPKTEIVYVLAKETFLRDRVAAVSNRVAMVQNGDRLELLERDRRFLRVKTDKGQIGWIEEHAVVNPEVVSGFEQLKKAQERDPVVATGILRDDGYLHLKPGRDTDRYYLLPEADKLQLLLRASVPKSVGPQASGHGVLDCRRLCCVGEKSRGEDARSSRKSGSREGGEQESAGSGVQSRSAAPSRRIAAGPRTGRRRSCAQRSSGSGRASAAGHGGLVDGPRQPGTNRLDDGQTHRR